MPPKRPHPEPAPPGPSKQSKHAKLKQVRPTTHLSRGENAKAIGAGNAGILSSLRPLPGALDVNNFVMARAFEISNLRKAMKTATAAATTRAFQTLPRHLRRRAASHNARRVPLRLRSKAEAEIAATDDTVKKQRKKAAKRAKGRRGETRTDVFRKRQRNKIWLETHIWHAKRMRMIDVWGHRLAKTPTLKSHRPSHRASRNGCIVHDSSYVSTLQISGGRNDVVQLLTGCTGGGSWMGSKYESGGRIASTTFYGFQKWPFDMIGPINILWKPLTSPSTSPSSAVVLWVRCHPSITDLVHSNLHQSATHIYSSRLATGVVQIEDLRGLVNAFDVMGPKAGRVLGGIMAVCGSEAKEKKEAWKWVKEVQTSAGMPLGMVVGVEVHDPRLQFPPTNIPGNQSTANSPSANQITPSSKLACSGLWDQVRAESNLRPKFRKSDLDLRRQKLGIPGSRLNPTSEDDRVPVLLIQRTIGSFSSNATHGYTLLLPTGWGMPFWQSLVFTGSLVAGQDEIRTQCLETGTSSFPEAFPGTASSAGWWAARAAEKDRRWQKRPPAKRFNPESLGLKMYRLPDWSAISNLVMEEPSLTPVDLEEQMTNDLEQEMAISPRQAKYYLAPAAFGRLCVSVEEPSESAASLWWTAVNQYRKALNLPVCTISANESYESCLVRVRLSMVGRGHPKEMAGLYAMTAKELSAWEKARTSSLDFDPNSALVELGKERTRPKCLIGFILMGGMSLSRGQGFGMGAVVLSRFMDARVEQGTKAGEKLFVRVRNDDEELSRMGAVELLMD